MYEQLIKYVICGYRLLLLSFLRPRTYVLERENPFLHNALCFLHAHSSQKHADKIFTHIKSEKHNLPIHVWIILVINFSRIA